MIDLEVKRYKTFEGIKMIKRFEAFQVAYNALFDKYQDNAMDIIKDNYNLIIDTVDDYLIDYYLKQKILEQLKW